MTSILSRDNRGMPCPKCGFDNARGAIECGRCGVVFAKLTRETPVDIRRYVMDEERVADGRIGRAELRILGIGLAIAIVAYAIPLTRFVFSAIVTLFHEIGHAIAGWLLGHPSIPAFDFVYGGGFTHQGQFRLLLAVLIAGVFAYGMWLFRENPKTVALIAVVCFRP
jgi:hypothetical protein